MRRAITLKPLVGKRIVVTRAQEDAASLSKLLREAGAELFEFPTISIEEIEPNNQRDARIQSINDYSYLIFTSQHGVKFFLKHFVRFHEIQKLQDLTVICIGTQTNNCLASYGIKSDFTPRRFQAESIVAFFKKETMIAHKKILIARAQEARNVIEMGLHKQGASVTVLPLYKVTLPQNSEKLKEIFVENHIDLVTFASSKTCSNFFHILGLENKRYLNETNFAVIGPITQKTLQNFGYSKAVVPKKYTIPSLVEAICDYYVEVP